MTPEPSGFHRRQHSLVDRACGSPTRYAGALASRNAALTATCCLDSHLSSKCPTGSKGDKHWAPSTNNNRWHADGVWRIEGRTLRARLRNKPCTTIHVHTFRVDEDLPQLIRSKSKHQHGRNWTVHRVQISSMILAAATFPPVSVLESSGLDTQTVLPSSLEGPGPEL